MRAVVRRVAVSLGVWLPLCGSAHERLDNFHVAKHTLCAIKPVFSTIIGSDLASNYCCFGIRSCGDIVPNDNDNCRTTFSKNVHDLLFKFYSRDTEIKIINEIISGNKQFSKADDVLIRDIDGGRYLVPDAALLPCPGASPQRNLCAWLEIFRRSPP